MLDAADGIVCSGAFSTAEEALAALGPSGTDVLLLDIRLPGMSGSDAVPLFRAAYPPMAILMLTVYSERPKVFASICNGATGYLLKSTRPEALVDAIRAVHAGGSPLSPEIARDIVDLFRKTAAPSEPATALTRQEVRLLGLLSAGYSYDTSALQMNVSVNTVRNYIRGIYEKLHVHSKSAAVAAALRSGLLQ
jgi:DNA-binding NarL/FixJ family response regulator